MLSGGGTVYCGGPTFRCELGGAVGASITKCPEVNSSQRLGITIRRCFQKGVTPRTLLRAKDHLHEAR